MSVSVSIDNAVAVVTVDRREAMNALDVTAAHTLRDRLAELATDSAVRCVILTGAGEKSFIAGADLKMMAQFDYEQGKAFVDLGHEIARLLETMPKPTIAAINGYALGGGCELALACDMRYAASHARLGQPEVNHGLIPGWGGTQRLARVTSLGFAKDLIFTGRLIDTDEALRHGLINGIGDPVLNKARETAQLITRKGPESIAIAKSFLNRALQGDYLETLADEAAALAHTLPTPEAREGLAAFLEKRPAAFQEPGA